MAKAHGSKWSYEKVWLSDFEFNTMEVSSLPIPYEQVLVWRCLIGFGYTSRWWRGRRDKAGDIQYDLIVSHPYIPSRPCRKPTRKAAKINECKEQEKYYNLANKYWSSEILNTNTLAEFIKQLMNGRGDTEENN